MNSYDLLPMKFVSITQEYYRCQLLVGRMVMVILTHLEFRLYLIRFNGMKIFLVCLFDRINLIVLFFKKFIHSSVHLLYLFIYLHFNQLSKILIQLSFLLFGVIVDLHLHMLVKFQDKHNELNNYELHQQHLINLY